MTSFSKIPSLRTLILLAGFSQILLLSGCTQLPGSVLPGQIQSENAGSANGTSEGNSGKPSAGSPGDNCIDGPLKLSDSQARQMNLSTVTVEMRTLPVELNVPAVVQANPNMTTPVTSLVPGRVEDVMVQHGDEVTRGKLLALVRSDEVGQIEAELLSKLLELEAERKQVQVKMQLAQKIYERKKTLLEEQIAARADLEVAENELEQERASLRAITDKQEANTEAVVQRLKLFGIERAEVERVIKTHEVHHQFEIRAPRSGVITLRDADPGEIITAGKNLFVIADLSQVWLTAQLPEKDVSEVKCGQPVKARVEGYPHKEFPGHLNFIDSHIETETRTLPVRATINNQDRILKPEMFGNLNIEIGKSTAYFLPSKCIQQIGESSVVYVRNSDKSFVERKVEAGRILGDSVEVVSGLKAGDVVAAEGSLKLLGMALQRLSK
ncbi:MAG TPA: efflux RND transporter periplasmic adaptor subunit [Candidatus Obscuribacter sp.]|nr:efflux RND transporter periplasmic adaptor subunit [Candidatus Obscuribacter sp.]HNM49330.1 efflux RND transporter periplasmic adaptor subunit [Candidatus Obscuribacter sp.]